MNFNEIEKKIAKVLFEVKAVKLNVNNPFTFASGIKSPIYCDNRHILGFSEARDTIINSFIESIKADDFDVIVGVATAGIPWASIIADRLNKPLAYVRNKPKGHGAGKQIEGAEVKGKKVLIIEDLITTGKSSLIAVEVLKKEGVLYQEVKSIFSYGFKEATKNYEQFNCKFTSLSNFNVLIQILKESNYLSEEEYENAKKWNKDPLQWSK